MIVVTVEIWPYGDRDRRKIIGQMTVSNAGSTGEDREVCQYIAKQYDPNEGTHAVASKVIERHDRRDGVWVLLQKALERLCT